MSQRTSPEWYNEAFDQFPPVLSELANRDKIISEGHDLPDADGARSSADYGYAIANNTFDQGSVRSSLKDLYLNSSHKLMANSHDNSHFFRWEGTFAEFERCSNLSQWYQITLPWDIFIYQEARDRFKWTQFYHRWVSAEEIMNNWQVFRWAMLVFVDRRVASNYEVWVEEQTVTFRIRTASDWISSKLPVYIYRFDTGYQARVKVSYRELANQYKWDYPFTALPTQVQGLERVILAFNLVLDEGAATLDRTISETLGDNLEFVQVDPIKPAINVGQITPVNVSYLSSKPNTQFWMTIISPKFFHEYPVLLCSDVIYRPWLPSMEPLKTLRQNLPSNVKADIKQTVTMSDKQVPVQHALRDDAGKLVWHDVPVLDAEGNPTFDLSGNPVVRREKTIANELRLDRTLNLPYPHRTVNDGDIAQYYIDRNNRRGDDYDGWATVTRPIVLSDAFTTEVEPYDVIQSEIDALTFDLINFAKTTDEFALYIDNESRKNAENWLKWISLLEAHGKTIYDGYAKWYDRRQCPRDQALEADFTIYFRYLSDLRGTGSLEDPNYTPWLNVSKLPSAWYANIRKLLAECYKLFERFPLTNIVDALPRKLLWYVDDEFKGKQRFNRPVDASDFLIMEYDQKRQVWRPRARTITHHFPDVYTITPPDGEEVDPNGIYKAFFFYSDTLNVTGLTRDVASSSKPQYDEELAESQSKLGDFKQIFIEKFYWLAMKSLYPDLMITGSRWEVIEYVLGNDSYRRFNELFLKSADPYFKLGLATYLNGTHTEFPFDDAIAKLKEQLKLRWQGYEKVASFEYYLRAQWESVYIDYLQIISDETDLSEMIRKRPPVTFDLPQLMEELQRILGIISFDISTALQWSLSTKILSADGGVVESTAIDTSVNAYRNKLEWAIDELEKDDRSLNLNTIRYLSIILDGLPRGLERLLHYLADRDPDVYSLAEIMTIVPWLASFELAVEETGQCLQRVADDLAANDNWQATLTMVDASAVTVKGELQSIAVNIMGEIAKLDINALNRVIDLSQFSAEPDVTSLLAIMRRIDYPWPKDVRMVYEAISVTMKRINSLHGPYRSLTEAEITECHAAIDELLAEMIALRHEVDRYWIMNSVTPNQELLTAMATADDIVGVFTQSMGRYHRNIESLYELSAKLVNDFNDKSITLSEPETKKFINPLESHLGSLTTLLSQLWPTPMESDVRFQIGYIQDIFGNWASYLQDESNIFAVLDAIVHAPELMCQLRQEVSTIKLIVDYLRSLTESFPLDTTVPTYTSAYIAKKIGIVSAGGRYVPDEIVHIPNLGTVRVTSVDPLGEVTGISEPIYFNSQFRNPTSISKYRTISEANGFGLVVSCLESESVDMIDHRIASTLIAELRIISRNLSDFSSTINPASNPELTKLLTRQSSVIAKLETIKKFYESNLSDSLQSDLVVSSQAFAISGPAIEKFISNRELIDVRQLLSLLGQLVTAMTKEQLDAMAANAIYDELFSYYGYGTSWSDRDRLIEIVDDTLDIVNVIETTPDLPAIITPITSLIRFQIDDIKTGMDQFDALVAEVDGVASAIATPLIDYDLAAPTVTTLHRFATVAVASSGEGYFPGDLVQLADNGNRYIFMVKSTSNGSVITVEPMMEYAFSETSWDCLITEPCGDIGVGHSLSLTLRSEQLDLSQLIPPSGELTLSASTVTKADKLIAVDATVSTAETPKRYDELDLISFRFNNTHDLDMNYEVFIGGKQVTDFCQRHEAVEGVTGRSKLDRIYLDTNHVDQLRTSSITIKPENYFTYRIHGLVISDPGSGYYAGQEIMLKANEVCLALKVVSVEGDPMKGIGEIALLDGEYIFEGTDPGGAKLEVVPDDICNLDDEFHVNEYDRTTLSGKIKQILINSETPTYLEVRPKTVNAGDVQPEMDDRNATFMYPEVGKPVTPFPPIDCDLNIVPPIVSNTGGIVTATVTSETDPIDPEDPRGDPEHGWYQGHRVDNSIAGQIASRWDGIADSEEIVGGVSDDRDRQPHGQPPRGEYQLIGRCRFHNGKVTPTDDLSDPRDNRGNLNGEEPDFYVGTNAELPRWPGDARYVHGSKPAVGNKIKVVKDEKHDGHAWLYRIREMSPTGSFRYDDGMICDDKWRTFSVNWCQDDSLADLPGIRYQYPGIDYHDGIRTWYGGVNIPILRQDTNVNKDMIPKRKAGGTYIHDLTVDDIAVYNVTTRRWEDLHDDRLWRLTVNTGSDPTNLGFNWGFRLTYLGAEPHSYDLKFYLCKVPRNQSLSQSLVRPAKIDVVASIDSEVVVEAQRLPVNTSREVRIRKLFPYRQSQAIGFLPDADIPKHRARMVKGILAPEGTKFFNLESSTKFLPPDGGELAMEVNMIPCSVGQLYFTIAQYMHFRNQIHLGDLKLYNHTAKRFEDLLDPSQWQVDIGSDINEIEELVISNYDAIPKTIIDDGGPTNIKVDVARQTRSHRERQTKVVSTVILDPGKGFEHGFVWGYNRANDLHVYGMVTSDETGDGHLLTFRDTHFPVKPESGTYTFEIYQRHEHGVDTAAKVTIEFATETVEIEDDGYLNGILNPMAPVKHKVRLTPKVPPAEFTIYEIFVDLTAKRFGYLNPEWSVNPTISIGEWQCPENRWYVMVDGVRFPLVNPSTGKRTLRVTEHADGVDVSFVNVSRAHEKLEFRTLPYPIRSVYTARKLPRHGYLDLAGKLNKPLSKLYYEFWVNGKLLGDEVTIVSPTKLFLHGLTSLRNFEIIELNRDPHEYFSDTFLKVYEPASNPRPHPLYDMKTYLDGALEGKRMGDEAFDVYTLSEQANLLEPVWPQVARDHPEYRNYPENVDVDPDILVRVFQEDLPLPDNLPDNSYELMLLDGPKLEGIELSGRNMTWSDFKLAPIDDQKIIDMLNEEWAKEIAIDPYLKEHFIKADGKYYGRTVRLYDELGKRVTSLPDSYYHVVDKDQLISVDLGSKTIQVHRSPNEIDLDQLQLK